MQKPHKTYSCIFSITQVGCVPETDVMLFYTAVSHCVLAQTNILKICGQQTEGSKYSRTFNHDLVIEYNIKYGVLLFKIVTFKINSHNQSLCYIPWATLYPQKSYGNPCLSLVDKVCGQSLVDKASPTAVAGKMCFTYIPPHSFDHAEILLTLPLQTLGRDSWGRNTRNDRRRT